MTTEIKDGTGSGTLAKVDDGHRLYTRAITQTELSHAVVHGETWNAGTGWLTLDTAAQSPLLYIKNIGVNELTIDLYVLLTRASTGGSGEGIVEILRNPTAGTIISGGTTVSATNMNFGSSNSPEATILSGGASGSFTISGEDDTLRSKVGAENRLLLGIITALPRGASVCIAYTPPAGNTSMDVEAVVEMYEVTV